MDREIFGRLSASSQPQKGLNGISNDSADHQPPNSSANVRTNLNLDTADLAVDAVDAHFERQYFLQFRP
ncbi:hypothetical protein EON65_37825 [archaeon]|nr:MAG: hypothetical protein EON65_37825 [archaeon]